MEEGRLEILLQWQQPAEYLSWLRDVARAVKGPDAVRITDRGIEILWGAARVSKPVARIAFEEIDWVHFSVQRFGDRWIQLMHVVDNEPSSSTFAIADGVQLAALVTLLRSKGLSVDDTLTRRESE